MNTCYVGLLIVSLASTNLFAWGERGHDAVTRVAVHLLSEHGEPDMERALIGTEHKLAHLSNLPDIDWRSRDSAVIAANRPTHYIDLEYLGEPKSGWTVTNLPQTMEDYHRAIMRPCLPREKSCPQGSDFEERQSRTGHAQFRVVQLAKLAEDLGKKIVALQTRKNLTKQLNSQIKSLSDKYIALLGLISHFIADLGNPLHTSVDYDGKLVGQGGLHAYFETRIVNEFPLSFAGDVYHWAVKTKPYQQISRTHQPKSLIQMVYAHILESHLLLDELFALDRKVSLKKKSGFLPAERRRPELVYQEYYAFAKARVGTAADVLSRFWATIHRRAGRPDLSRHRSYDYPITHEFVPVDYLPHAN
ncbi:MAG: hypothetical protein HRU19_31505 [Pseudobacteriovorax sp.]|nr:hypothetical protein [Pseudobacteriovorax sp.]